MTNRRSFLSSLGAISGLAFLSKTDKLEAMPSRVASASSSWDLSWLDAFKGKHRQLFDFGDADISEESHLRVVRNWLNAHKEVFGLESPEVNTIVGIAGSAYPLNASDRLWQAYPIGEQWKIKDPKTNTWAKRNVYDVPGDIGPRGPSHISALVARGTVFWQCNNAFGGVVSQLAKAVGKPADVVRADLLAGMMPGVHLVPAHTMLVGLAQEHGFAYEAM
ncbi:MAG: hypothetical protein H0W63_10435 [Gemmatimonadaceae bacterium]|nr:hypothetical protein [Gemmatimonadaceae bacterium]